MKKFYRGFSMISIAFFCSSSAYSDSISLDEVYRLCRAVDAAVEGIRIEAKGVLERFPIPDHRLEEIRNAAQERSNSKLQQGRLQAPRIHENEFVQRRTLTTMKVDGRIKFTIVTEPTEGLNATSQSHTIIHDIDKVFIYGPAALNSDQKQFTIDDRSLNMPLGYGTVNCYGRGLSEFVGYPMEILKRDDGLYDLTVLHIDGKETFVTFVLNPEFGMCWQEFKRYTDGDVSTISIAENFQQLDGVWYPATVTATTFYPTGELYSRRILEVADVSFIENKDDVAQQLLLSHLVKPGDVVIDSRNR